MKKVIWLLIIVFLATLVIIFNVNVNTWQGINYEWHTISIPLYLKILDFFDRHYNYKQLVKRITIDARTDQKCVMRIFEWTYKNIKKVPENFPIIDDHVWHIIVRGYGATDQFSDVFTTLCNYARLKAFYGIVYTKDKKSRIVLSFVRLYKEWTVFDPYNGIYFENKEGNIADIEDIRKNRYIIKNISDDTKLNFDYKKYLENLSTIQDIGLNRANIQSPLRRIIFEVKKWLKIK
jgi:hypothetical protein